MTGRKAILGMGKPTDTTGSNNQRTATLRDIAMPSDDTERLRRWRSR